MNKLSSEPPGDQTVSGSASAHQLAPHDDYEDEIDDDDICDNYDDYDDCDRIYIPAHQPGPQHFLQVCYSEIQNSDSKQVSLNSSKHPALCWEEGVKSVEKGPRLLNSSV